MHVFDADVAIRMRDDDLEVLSIARTLEPPFALSILTRVELENGVVRNPALAEQRRARLDLMLPRFKTIPFLDAELAAYRRIVERSGFSRRKIIDRMVAATALVHGARLITSNIEDFSDIDGLVLVPIPPAA